MRSCHREGVDAAAPDDRETKMYYTKTWRIFGNFLMKFC